MIKTLQKKFIFTSMTAIGVLLTVLLFALNAANIYSARRQDETVLDMLSGKEFSVLWQLPNEFNGNNNTAGFLQPPMDENMRRSSIYFIAYADREGKIIFVDTSRTASLTRENAASIAENAVKAGKLTGKIGLYRYKAVRTENNIGTAYIFLDISHGRSNIIRTLFISATAALICFGLMLLLIAALSKKAIRPIAENMEKQKNFVTDAGHEIKTPLAIILANTEALELHGGETKWSRNIKEQTERLSRLMQDLLSLSRLEDTKTDKMAQSLCVSDIVSDTVSMFCENAALRNIKINTDIQPDVFMKGDREHIVRLVSLLTDNAVKYSLQGENVDIRLCKREKKFVFSVSNMCESLPECDSDKLFDRFYRGDSARNQKNGGYGIGLSAARAITELYKGKITAEYIQPARIIFTVIM